PLLPSFASFTRPSTTERYPLSLHDALPISAALDDQRQIRTGNQATAYHHLLATADPSYLPVGLQIDDIAVGHHGHRHRLAYPGPPGPVRRRAIALFTRARVNGNRRSPPGSQGPGTFEGLTGIAVAQAHLGRDRDTGRERRAHCRYDTVEGFRLAQQGGAATVTVDRLGRATEVQIHRRRTQIGQPGAI